MRIHFVLNPQAGKGRSLNLAAAIRREFAGHDVIISSEPPKLPEPKPFRIEDLIWPATGPEAPDLVVAAGGDGTVNRVINAVAVRNVPVGIIPCGSSNDLAGQLDIPTDFQQACRIIRSAGLTDIDLISVNGRYFATCGGLGLAADVARRANAWRDGFDLAGDTARQADAQRSESPPPRDTAQQADTRCGEWLPDRDTARRADARRRGCRWTSRLARWLGRLIYPLAVIRELSGGWRPPTARVLCGGEDRVELWLSLLISNQPRFGGFTASPQADHRDGRADICRMRASSRRLRMLWISLQTYLGRADVCSEVSHRRARQLTILAQEPVNFFGDGEILDRSRFFGVQVHPRALWVATPRGTRTWSWWSSHRDRQEQLLKYYLRRPSCRPMTISVPAAGIASSGSNRCPPGR